MSSVLLSCTPIYKSIIRWFLNNYLAKSICILNFRNNVLLLNVYIYYITLSHFKFWYLHILTNSNIVISDPSLCISLPSAESPHPTTYSVTGQFLCCCIDHCSKIPFFVDLHLRLMGHGGRRFHSVIIACKEMIHNINKE